MTQATHQMAYGQRHTNSKSTGPVGELTPDPEIHYGVNIRESDVRNT